MISILGKGVMATLTGAVVFLIQIRNVCLLGDLSVDSPDRKCNGAGTVSCSGPSSFESQVAGPHASPAVEPLADRQQPDHFFLIPPFLRKSQTVLLIFVLTPPLAARFHAKVSDKEITILVPVYNSWLRVHLLSFFLFPSLSMSLKQELETHAAALAAYDRQDFQEAIKIFQTIANTSKIHTNIGLIYATLGKHEQAVDSFNAATELDQYLAIAYFQCGVSNFLLGRFDYALRDFEEALLYLRRNQNIDYEQLGLKFKLYSAEVLFNKGLCRIYLGDERGLDDMVLASREKVVREHDVIDEAIRDKGDQYTVFSIPVGILFRPSAMKLKNTKSKDYLGKAKLISATGAHDAFTTFTGVTRLNQGQLPSGAPIDNDLNRTNSSSTSRSVPATAETKVSDDSFKDDNEPLARIKRDSYTGSCRFHEDHKSTSSWRATWILSAASTCLGLTCATATHHALPGPKPLADIYDGYLEEYANEKRSSAGTGSPPRPQGISKAAAGLPPSNRSSDSVGNAPKSTSGSLRRKRTRKPTRSFSRARGRSYDQEDEEGYASGDYEEWDNQFVKILVKIHYQGDNRGMTLAPDTPYKDFVDKVAAKFGALPSAITFKFKDQEDEKVSLLDASDYDLALETARAFAKGKPEGRLEVWCFDA
ncbi:hypothetical protein BS47DRAFT_1396612 [Hydnum rufescens UP504]|uniref:PB1 domain-containing protein n=1 Tax=Hydnum rufescens UP504 TaxID=1448309 RepID=A0A9P6DSR3_9AGAM|nr:hypothetical protein BS47DRAFT_1396612 [Hydnum rufescens UP504]